MWWKNLRLSGKLLVGFGVVIALLVGVGLWSVFGINGIVTNAQEVIDGNEFRGNMTQREVDHLNWAIGLNRLLTDETVHELTVETDPTKCAFGQWYHSDARRQAEALMPAIAPLLAEIEAPHNHLHESAVTVADHYVDIDEDLGAFLREKKVDHLAWAHQIKDAFMDTGVTSLAGVEVDHTQCSLGRFLYSEETQQKRREDAQFDAAIAPIYEPHQRLHESAGVIAENLAQGELDAMRAYYMQTTSPLADDTLGAIDGLIGWHDERLQGLEEANRIYATETTGALEEVQSLLGRIVDTSAENVMTDEVMLSAAQGTQQGVLVTIVVATLVGVVLAIVIARGIVKPLVKGVSFSREIAHGDLRAELNVNQRDEVGQLADAMREMQRTLQQKALIVKRFSEGDFSVDFEKVSEKDELGESLVVMQESLNDILGQVRVAVEQVAAGASQVSSASQDLSQGATESASSLEEISSSVNEINGQSRQNTDNAAEASQLSKQAASDAEGGQGQMQELRTAMDSISGASEEIKKVVKVIDDIAFQINLLALNANVEAARAGKYGKGFAVVAEEVRNLAVRSAEAVKETTAMVEQSVESIETGNELTARTAEQLDSIVSGAQRVAQFLEEIAAASKEQSLAIDQITEGLGQVDQVTQSNTASAEESASASEELSSQAEQLRVSVERFKLKRGEESQASAVTTVKRVSAPAAKERDGLASAGGADDRPKVTAGIPANGSNGNGSNGHASNGNGARPQEIIELDDDEYDRF